MGACVCVGSPEHTYRRIVRLDPLHMRLPGEDAHGFRAISERSMLADAMKDSGAVTMFPPLAEEWWAQVQAQSGWEHFQVEDFQRLKAKYGVTWIFSKKPALPGMKCPTKIQRCKFAV